MRTSILAAAVLFGVLTAPFPVTMTTATAAFAQEPAAPPQAPPPEAPPQAPAQPTAQPDPAQPQPQVNVEVSSPSWYMSPTWIAIGVIGVVLLVMIVVMSTRSGANTVIRG
jgi:hypothetical protein